MGESDSRRKHHTGLKTASQLFDRLNGVSLEATQSCMSIPHHLSAQEDAHFQSAAELNA